MAFKVGNETVIQDIDASAAIVTNSNLDKLQINTTDVLVHDGVTITLKNVELDISVESTINTDNITEGATNKFYSTSLFDTDFATKTTSDLTEGTNLYYTDARAVTALIPTTSALLPLAGGTMTGALILNGAPTTALQAATKAYVDSAVSSGTGALDTDDISEGTTNLYYTDARVGAYLSNNNFATEAYVDTAEVDAVNTANAYTDQAETDAVTTANAYTDTRETAITSAYESYADTGDTTTYNASKSYTDTEIATVLPLSGGTLTGPLTLSGLPTNTLHAVTKSYVDALNTDDISEGSTNLYYTNARFDTRLGTKSTTDLAEGTNLYYTDARVDARLSGGSLGSLTTTGNIDVGGNIQVDGDLTVLGTTTTVLSESTRINENLLYLNEGGESTITNAVGNGSTVTYTADNSYSIGYTVDITGVNPSSFNVTDATITASDGTSFTISSSVTDTYVSGGESYGHAHVNVDLGWSGAYDDGTYHHAGFFRDATDGLFKVFDSYVPEPNVSPDINTGHASFSLADFQAENVHLNSAPTLSTHATTKSYVDSAVTSGTGGLDTDDISEGSSNLYYTDARVDARIPTNISSFTNDSGYATTGQLPTNNNQLTNGAGYITSFTDTTYTAGTGLNLVGTTFNNTAPDQTVSLTGSGATSISGTYPNFTISSTDTDTNTTYTAGNGLTLTSTEFKMSGSYTGSFTATGDVTAYSDERLKTNVTTIEDALSKVKSMRGVMFDKEDSLSGDLQKSTGVIAQETEKVLPEVVHNHASGYKSVAYGNMVGILIEAIKEQQQQIDKLVNEVEFLKGKR